MSLYLKSDHIERALEGFEQIQAVVDLIAAHVANQDTDLTDKDERYHIICALSAVSDMAAQAKRNALEAIAKAYHSPKDFDGESFRA